MGSLFHDSDGYDSDCYPKKKHKHHYSKCEGCVCHILNKYANGWDDCSLMTGNQKFYLQMKGTTDYIDLFTSPGVPTEFTLIHFCPKTCCAKFTYETGSGSNRRTIMTYYDCRCLCGISPVPTP
ncbi:hypothetical protein [Guptibacillus hwajinpoensis]|uniref:Spore coat protein n=1 Tax=Guptibacillus hwajinpoensis TaxID=208199 RepID=A0ABU0K201_9BACL|nr:hypothetical protein [Alkalihalobacillus hemicentroti]MDQ0483388.1 hypothetical protein [Alkalihalobacillus hemicentroti]